MPVIRHSQHHCIDVLPGHQFPVIVVSFAVLVAVLLVDLIYRGLQVVLVDVTCRDDLAFLEAQKSFRITGALHSPSHYPHRYPFRGAPDRRRHNGWSGKGDTGGSEETTTANSGIKVEFLHKPNDAR